MHIMSQPEPEQIRKRLLVWLVPEKPRRLLVLFGVFLLIVAGDWWHRRWHPTATLATEHYFIQSSATSEQTKAMADAVESLHAAYARVFAEFPQVHEAHPLLQMKLFKDRIEFRRCNRGLGWAEAYYLKPHCNAYFAAAEINPYHWMLHEAVHQLNHEVARFPLAKWFDEGLGEYFGTSLVKDGTLLPGRIDPNTYPIWWLDEMNFAGDLRQDIARTNVIPLDIIISGKGGPDIDEHFNLYYIHWWSLTHFLLHFDEGKYRTGFFAVIREGGTLASFTDRIGPIERVQGEWYHHLLEQKKSLYRPPAKRPKPESTKNTI